MKGSVILLLSLVAFACGAELTQEELREAKTINLFDLDEKPDLFAGKVVKVRFTARGDRMDKEGDGWRSTIHQERREKFTFHISAAFPQAGFEWFRRLPTTFEKGRSVLAFARVTKREGYTGYTVELIGREAKISTKGVELVW